MTARSVLASLLGSLRFFIRTESVLDKLLGLAGHRSAGGGRRLSGLVLGVGLGRLVVLGCIGLQRRRG